MAGTVENVQIFDSTMRTLTTEQVAQDFNKFNGMSNGGILLNGSTTAGDYDIESFIKYIGEAAFYRRDVASTGTKTAAAYAEGELVKVQMAGGFYVEVPEAILMHVASGQAVNSQIAGAYAALASQYSQKYLQDQFNTSCAALGAAIENNTAMTNDQSGTATITQLQLNNTRALLGDRANDLACWVMHSGAYYDLVGDAIANANALDTVGGVAINQGSVQAGGLPIIVTDDPALAYNDGTQDVYKVLGLTNAASMVTNIKQISTTDRATGNENIVGEWQANYSYDLGVKGYSWNSSVGGRTPTDAEVATGTNWTKVVTSNKDTAGVCAIFDQD